MNILREIKYDMLTILGAIPSAIYLWNKTDLSDLAIVLIISVPLGWARVITEEYLKRKRS